MGKSKVGGSAEETSEQTVQSSVNSSVEHFRHRNSRKGGVMNGEENFEDVDEYRFYEKKSNQQIFVNFHRQKLLNFQESAKIF